MAPSNSEAGISVPLPIYRISRRVERYMLYDAATFMWLRKAHNILGVLMGTLPQVPQQNIFLGLPVELQPEEARMLVEKGLAYVVDDLESHENGIIARTAEDKDRLRSDLRREGFQLANKFEQERQMRAQKAQKKVRELRPMNQQEQCGSPVEGYGLSDESKDSLFDAQAMSGRFQSQRSSSSEVLKQDQQPWSITLTSSSTMSQGIEDKASSSLPVVNPPSYAIFKHLHDNGYFMAPGLRFGCQFSVYPGDPLRFHSHFLAVGAEWDEEFDLLHLIAGGRLGTGVKKGYMIGGVEREKKQQQQTKDVAIAPETANSNDPSVRTFCIEWIAM